MNILLVEDDASIVSALTDLLHSEGFSVQACATQDAACEALARTTFDIALLDVTLPQGNGFAVCAAAREAAPEMPVIFLTASDDEYSTVTGLDMGRSTTSLNRFGHASSSLAFVAHFDGRILLKARCWWGTFASILHQGL